MTDAPDAITTRASRADTMKPLEVVVLVSGTGSLLQALIDDAGREREFEIVAVGADRECAGLERALLAGIPTFVVDTTRFPDRRAWDDALADAIERSYDEGPIDPGGARTAGVPRQLVVSAGFMKILGEATLSRHTVINTHPALLPSFPGAHGVRDALAHGVKVTGTTCHVVDAGVDTGPIIAQRAVAVRDDDDEAALHERIKVQEREMLTDVVRALARGWHINGRTVSINE